MSEMQTFDFWSAAELVFPPGTIAGGPTIVPSTYIDMGDFDRIVFIIAIGACAATDTLNAKLVQATSAAGAGSKDITGAAITALADADDNQFATIELKAEALDVAGGFRYVSLSYTKAGAGTLVASIFAFRYKGGGLPPTKHASYNEAVEVVT